MPLLHTSAQTYELSETDGVKCTVSFYFALMRQRVRFSEDTVIHFPSCVCAFCDCFLTEHVKVNYFIIQYSVLLFNKQSIKIFYSKNITICISDIRIYEEIKEIGSCCIPFKFLFDLIQLFKSFK